MTWSLSDLAKAATSPCSRESRGSAVDMTPRASSPQAAIVSSKTSCRPWMVGRAAPARKPHADHEGESRLELLAAALVADIAVVLLIDSVEFHQLVVFE